LNGLDLDSIRFSGPGTDLEIGLLPTSSWSGGGIETKTGVFHVPNMPTEEVFTCPDRRRTRGHVRSTRPLSLGGTIVWDLEVAFEDGAIVDVNASAGADAVRGQLQVDEWAPYLGEVALVDGSSRVGRTGMVFSNTLFDENATCHIAYGNAVQFALEDGGDPNDADAARAQGVNVSVAHTDFMIGGPEVTVDGITRNGRTVRLIEGDRWQI
jgi:aminopeptidase